MSSRTFIGDVHGCSEELRTLLDNVQPTRGILVGDMFRKGPDNLGVWRLIQQWNLEAVIGNHDLVLLKEKEAGFPKALLKWIKGLPMSIDGIYQRDAVCSNWTVVHAGINPIEPEKTTLREAVTLRRYPNDSSDQLPFCGNDQEKLDYLWARCQTRCLQDHRPKTLGLDTGCVKGNGLTAF